MSLTPRGRAVVAGGLASAVAFAGGVAVGDDIKKGADVVKDRVAGASVGAHGVEANAIEQFEKGIVEVKEEQLFLAGDGGFVPDQSAVVRYGLDKNNKLRMLVERSGEFQEARASVIVNGQEQDVRLKHQESFERTATPTDIFISQSALPRTGTYELVIKAGELGAIEVAMAAGNGAEQGLNQ